MDEKLEEWFMNRLMIFLIVIVVGIGVNAIPIFLSIKESPFFLLLYLLLIPAEIGLFICFKGLLELEKLIGGK